MCLYTDLQICGEVMEGLSNMEYYYTPSFSFLGLPEGVKDDITTPIIIAVLILAAVAAVGAAGVFVYKKRSGE